MKGYLEILFYERAGRSHCVDVVEACLSLHSLLSHALIQVAKITETFLETCFLVQLVYPHKKISNHIHELKINNDI